jgi:hypothetical protein
MPHTSARTLLSGAVQQIVGKQAQAAASTPWAQIGGLFDRHRGY